MANESDLKTEHFRFEYLQGGLIRSPTFDGLLILSTVQLDCSNIVHWNDTFRHHDRYKNVPRLEYLAGAAAVLAGGGGGSCKKNLEVLVSDYFLTSKCFALPCQCHLTQLKNSPNLLAFCFLKDLANRILASVELVRKSRRRIALSRSRCQFAEFLRGFCLTKNALAYGCSFANVDLYANPKHRSIITVDCHHFSSGDDDDFDRQKLTLKSEKLSDTPMYEDGFCSCCRQNTNYHTVYFQRMRHGAEMFFLNDPERFSFSCSYLFFILRLLNMKENLPHVRDWLDDIRIRNTISLSVRSVARNLEPEFDMYGEGIWCDACFAEREHSFLFY